VVFSTLIALIVQLFLRWLKKEGEKESKREREREREKDITSKKKKYGERKR
jgi:hypothetical protein